MYDRSPNARTENDTGAVGLGQALLESQSQKARAVLGGTPNEKWVGGWQKCMPNELTGLNTSFSCQPDHTIALSRAYHHERGVIVEVKALLVVSPVKVHVLRDDHCASKRLSKIKI